MEKTLTALKNGIDSWPGASVRFRDDWHCEYFSVAEKSFALLSNHKDWGWQLAVKGLPNNNEELREQYNFIVPGYHLNKTHWNSIILKECTLSEGELMALLKNSYQLIVAKLPKKVRETL